MSKQESSKSPLPANAEGTLVEHRYYVQHLTEQIFLVRERLSAGSAPGADDRIVRSFNVLRDAYMYASSMNEAQGKQVGAVPPERGKVSES